MCVELPAELALAGILPDNLTEGVEGLHGRSIGPVIVCERFVAVDNAERFYVSGACIGARAGNPESFLPGDYFSRHSQGAIGFGCDHNPVFFFLAANSSLASSGSREYFL